MTIEERKEYMRQYRKDNLDDARRRNREYMRRKSQERKSLRAEKKKKMDYIKAEKLIVKPEKIALTGIELKFFNLYGKVPNENELRQARESLTKRKHGPTI